ncbi:hypothetical protein, partial [Sphingobium yanoikuyae]|uniref:hypothetical protein n=1 Tax=Sphingobium yanoikuyae TaxID=13690 RepID=UPI003F03B7AD
CFLASRRIVTRTRAENRQKSPGVSAGVSVNLTLQKDEKSAKSRHYSSIVSEAKRSDGRACGAFDQDVIALRSAASPTVR